MNHPSSVQHHADQLDEMRPPFVEKQNAWRPPWSAEEDVKILSRHGHGTAGQDRRHPRWNMNNYPRRDHGNNHDKSFGAHEEELIIKLHATIGSRWAIIAQQLPGRAESEVKNCWNTKLKKRLTEMGIDPVTHKPFSQVLRDYGNIGGNARGVGNRVGSIHHSKDLRNAYLSNSNSKSQQQRRQQQQQFTPIQFHARPSKAPAMMLNSPLPKSSAESLSWADFLVSDYGFSGDHIPNEATGGLPLSLPDDPYRNLTPSGNAVECLSSSSSSSSSVADDSFVETLLNKHTEMFMDFPEIWDESIR